MARRWGHAKPKKKPRGYKHKPIIDDIAAVEQQTKKNSTQGSRSKEAFFFLGVFPVVMTALVVMMRPELLSNSIPANREEKKNVS